MQILSRRSSRLTYWCALAAVSASLVACGGGGDAAPPAPAPAPEPSPAPAPAPAPAPSPTPSPAPAPEPDPEPPPIPAPGERGGLQSVRLVNTLSAQQVSAALAESRLGPDSTLAPRYDVSNYRITYTTTDKNGQRVSASGLVSVPVKPASAPSPVLSYQHATTFRNDEAPSIKVEPGEPPIVLSSLGYIVVSPDYVGFGSTQGLDHPYLTAEPTAHSVVDLLVAARTWRWEQGVQDNGQLFLAGYSEGGYATMAAHRALQQAGGLLGQQLLASAPGAGPYDVQMTLDELRSDLPRWLRELFSPGNLRNAPESVRNEVRRLLVRQLLPDDADVAYQTLFVDRYLADDREAIARDHSVHLGWKPEAPMYLFHGQGDQTVPYAVSISALNALRDAGASEVTLTDCATSDLGHTGCVPEYFNFVVERFGRLAQDL